MTFGLAISQDNVIYAAIDSCGTSADGLPQKLIQFSNGWVLLAAGGMLHWRDALSNFGLKSNLLETAYDLASRLDTHMSAENQAYGLLCVFENGNPACYRLNREVGSKVCAVLSEDFQQTQPIGTPAEKDPYAIAKLALISIRSGHDVVRTLVESIQSCIGSSYNVTAPVHAAQSTFPISVLDTSDPVRTESATNDVDHLQLPGQSPSPTMQLQSLSNPLLREWDTLPKDWYSIYQWPQASNETGTEQIASLILKAIDRIHLGLTDLRQDHFRVTTHEGQAKLSTSISQFTEKRFVRAMFNCGEPTTLGRAIDYEIPLKGTAAAPHGDIDLLCLNGRIAFIIEVKQPNSSESILKGILQSFVYSSLVAHVKSRFLTNFGLSESTVLTPSFLTFQNSTSGRQLSRMDNHPRLRELIRALNNILATHEIAPMRFFAVQDEDAIISSCLTTDFNSLSTKQRQNGEVKIVFRNGFVPCVYEHQFAG